MGVSEGTGQVGPLIWHVYEVVICSCILTFIIFVFFLGGLGSFLGGNGFDKLGKRQTFLAGFMLSFASVLSFLLAYMFERRNGNENIKPALLKIKEYRATLDTLRKFSVNCNKLSMFLGQNQACSGIFFKQ